MDDIIHFFYMGGYGFYVWTAYGSVISFLLIEGIRHWIRWHRYCRKQKIKFLFPSDHPNESKS